MDLDNNKCIMHTKTLLHAPKLFRNDELLDMNMKFVNLLLLATLLFLLSGCFLTKIVTVPMRIGGAVISVIPVVGNTAHDAIDEAAEVVDIVPL